MLNIQRMMRFIAVFFSGLSAVTQAATPPDAYEFTVSATIIEPQCKWVHSGQTTADLGELTIGLDVKKDVPVGTLKGICDSTRITPFGFTVDLIQTSKNGITHSLWNGETQEEIKSGHMEVYQNDITSLVLRTEGTPTQVGSYTNNIVMNITYD